MSILPSMDDVKTILKLIDALYSLGKDAAPYIQMALDIANGKKSLNQEDRNLLIAQETALRLELQKPIE